MESPRKRFDSESSCELSLDLLASDLGRCSPSSLDLLASDRGRRSCDRLLDLLASDSGLLLFCRPMQFQILHWVVDRLEVRPCHRSLLICFCFLMMMMMMTKISSLNTRALQRSVAVGVVVVVVMVDVEQVVAGYDVGSPAP